MIVQPIVEGHGDVAAVPLLLRRLVNIAEAWDVTIARPHRRKRSQLIQKDYLQNAVRIARLTPSCSGILIIFDADDDCPKELAPNLESWAQAAAVSIPVAVVMANREYEAWLLAGIAALRVRGLIRDDVEDHPNPESPRDAKFALETRMKGDFGYSETVDQAPLTEQFDLEGAYRNSRSFRKLITAFGQLLSASGIPPLVWPPAEWTS